MADSWRGETLAERLRKGAGEATPDVKPPPDDENDDGHGIVSRQPVCGVAILCDDDYWHGVEYAAIQGEFRMPKDGHRIEFSFESDAGLFAVTVDGHNLFPILRHLKSHYMDTLHAGHGCIEKIRIRRVKAEG